MKRRIEVGLGLVEGPYVPRGSIPSERELMKDLVWDRTLSVDVPEIDEDHRRLVDLFNLL